MMEPFAVQLYRRLLQGESADRLSADLHIPLDRIEMRLRAAEKHLRDRPDESAEPALVVSCNERWIPQQGHKGAPTPTLAQIIAAPLDGAGLARDGALSPLLTIR